MIANAPVVTILPAGDLSRARTFYEGKLGLRPISEKETGVMYECGGGTMLYIYQRESTKAEHTVAGFSVEDIEVEVGALRAKSVEFEEYNLPGIKTVDWIATMERTKRPGSNILKEIFWQ